MAPLPRRKPGLAAPPSRAEEPREEPRRAQDSFGSALQNLLGSYANLAANGTLAQPALRSRGSKSAAKLGTSDPGGVQQIGSKPPVQQ